MEYRRRESTWCLPIMLPVMVLAMPLVLSRSLSLLLFFLHIAIPRGSQFFFFKKRSSLFSRQLDVDDHSVIAMIMHSIFLFYFLFFLGNLGLSLKQCDFAGIGC
jgi:hypothetical protein